MIRTLYKLVAVNASAFAGMNIQLLGMSLGLTSIEKKYFQEFRCPIDNKLLAKGFLKDSGSILEAKCRACGTVHYFQGEDKEIILTRKELIQDGKIPDTE